MCFAIYSYNKYVLLHENVVYIYVIGNKFNYNVKFAGLLALSIRLLKS